MTSPRTFDLTSIPEWSTRLHVDAAAPVLVWVIAGTATATFEQTTLTLGPSSALWVPAESRAILRGGAGSSMLPIRVRGEDRASGPTEPFVAAVPTQARPLLLGAFTRSLGVLHGGGARAAALLRCIGDRSILAEAPSRPRSPELQEIAQTLLSSPTVAPADAAREHGVGVSTLTRRFRAETGWTPARWRTRHVLARAAEHIREQGTVGAGCAAAGYGSPQAFARAFRREWGIAPAELIDGGEPREPLRARPLELGPQRNGYHVVFWVAAGAATAVIDAHAETMREGEIFCLPAGADVAVRAPAGSAVLPLGWLPGGIDLPGGRITSVSADAFDALARLTAWAYAGVEPGADVAARDVLQRALDLETPSAASPDMTQLAFSLLERLSSHPEDSRSVTELAAHTGVDGDELRRAFEALTGTSLAVWRARTRMSRARGLLREGVTASQVARRVGYADAAAFSRAFARAHGHPPTRFQAAERHARTA